MREPLRRMCWRPGLDPPELVLTREWLLTNGLGGYAAGTVAGVITRRYIPGRWSETLYRVHRFWEKPRLALGEELLTRGCFWSSFVMVAQPIVLATLIRRELPFLVERFLALRTRLAEPGDSDRVRQLYTKLGAADFSRQILAARPPNLAVLPVSGVDWSDLNHPERAGLAMARAGIDLPSTSTSLPA